MKKRVVLYLVLGLLGVGVIIWKFPRDEVAYEVRLRTRELKDKDPRVRKAAAEHLGELDSQTAVPALIQALQDEVKWVLGSVLEALQRIGPVAVPALTQALNDQDPRVVVGAAEILGRIGPQAAESVPALIEILNSQDTSAPATKVSSVRRAYLELRVAAITALGKIGDPAADAVPVLIEILKTDERLRWRAAEALGGIGPKAIDAVPELTMMTLKETNRAAAQVALVALQRIDPEVIATAPVLVRALRDPDRSVRIHAAKKVLTGLRRTDPGLVRLGPAAIPELLKALDDEDRTVRESAVAMLGQLGSEAKDAVPAIIEAMRSRRVIFYGEAALVQIGQPAVLELLKTLQDERFRETASRLLDKIGVEVSVVALIAALRDEDTGLRAGADRSRRQGGRAHTHRSPQGETGPFTHGGQPCRPRSGAYRL